MRSSSENITYITTFSTKFNRSIDINFYFKYSNDVKYCDVVIVESRFVYRDWSTNKSKIFELLIDLKTMLELGWGSFIYPMQI